MPINLGNGLVTGNIIMRTSTGGGGGGGGGGASVNVPSGSILYSSSGTDICGNSGMQYDGNVATIDLLDNGYLNGNYAQIGDYYYDSTILYTLSPIDWNYSQPIDNSFRKGPLTITDVTTDNDYTVFNSSKPATIGIFDGTTSQISTIADPIFNLGQNGGTIELFFKLGDTSTQGSIFTLASDTNEHRINFYSNADKNVNLVNGGVGLFLVTAGYTVNPIWDISGLDTTTWYYFALSIHNNTTYNVYFGSGYPNKIALNQTILNPTLESYTNPYIILGSSYSGNYFPGSITNVRVTSIQRYTEATIPIPLLSFPPYNVGLNTNGARFNMRQNIDNELGLFIGANDTNQGDIIIGCNSLTFDGGSSNSDNIAIGNNNLQNVTTTIDRNIIIGYNNASTNLQYLNNIVGSNNTIGNYYNCSILGNSAFVTNNNQNQIGGTVTTTYVYGTVHNRSDIRDKADIQDIPLGLDFVNKLKPKFYRWNYREDYRKVDLSGNLILDSSGNVIYEKNDGTKKRVRFHAGLIAQDVKEVMDESSIDFGAYQDHSVKGGKDVKSLGYDEFIPVLIKAIQELSAKNTELENRIKILENK